MKTVADLPFNFDGYVMVESERQSTALYERYMQRIAERYEAQDRIYRWGSLVAPMLAIQSISMSMAGTDFAHQRDLSLAAEAYRASLTQAMNAHIRDAGRYGDRSLKADESTFRSVPDFHYDSPPVGWALRDQLVTLGTLGVWFLGSVWLAVNQARKMVAF